MSYIAKPKNELADFEKRGNARNAGPDGYDACQKAWKKEKKKKKSPTAHTEFRILDSLKCSLTAPKQSLAAQKRQAHAITVAVLPIGDVQSPLMVLR